ncbi:MAG TPA: methionyl-tRNA formyltransferase [Geminicoccaceae bacterium]|nr:methionyl-tRNA formyltransferase [Geminicoccaceae bacterium]
MRVVFMGTSAFAVPALRALATLPHELLAVYTQPPRPAGRGHHPRRTAVHEAAEALGLAVRTPASLKDEAAQADFLALRPDLVIVASYGLLLRRPVLEAARLGCFNIHASLLPRWRGAAPIQRAIELGDAVSGITLFRMEEGLDTGPMLVRRALEIGPRETAGELHDRLAELAAALLPRFIADLAAGRLAEEPQDDSRTCYARKLEKSEARIDFTQPAAVLERRIRAFDPWPGTWCLAGKERLAVLEARVDEGQGEPGTIIGSPLTVACGEGALELVRVRREGRKPVTAAELQRGFPLPPGTRLT